MKKSVIFTFFVSATFFTTGQHHVDVSMQAGMSKMNSLNSNESQAESRTRIEDTPEWSIGLSANYEYQFGEFSVRSGLQYRLIQGTTKESFTVYPWIQNEGYPSLIELITERKCSYLRLPISFHYQADKVQIGIGMYAAYLLSNSYWSHGYNNSDPFLFQGGGNNLLKFDAGFLCEVSYELDKKFNVVLQASAGLIDVSNGTETGATNLIYGLNPMERSLKNREFSLGLRYRLF